MNGIIAKKIGMTQIFREGGEAVPVTVFEAGSCVVIQVKTRETDGYDAAQIGFVEKRTRSNKPKEGHFKKHNVSAPVRIVREISYTEKPEPGQTVTVEIFKNIPIVDITGTVKGRGFTGVVKRWGLKGGPKTHGSMFHRAPGSIGASSFPSRVWKGQKMGGRYGNESATIQNLEVIDIDTEQNLLTVKGSVPGARGCYVFIQKAKKHRGDRSKKQ